MVFVISVYLQNVFLNLVKSICNIAGDRNSICAHKSSRFLDRGVPLSMSLYSAYFDISSNRLVRFAVIFFILILSSTTTNGFRASFISCSTSRYFLSEQPMLSIPTKRVLHLKSLHLLTSSMTEATPTGLFIVRKGANQTTRSSSDTLLISSQLTRVLPVPASMKRAPTFHCWRCSLACS